MKTMKFRENVTALDISKARVASGNSFDVVSFKPSEEGGVLKYIGDLPQSLQRHSA